MEQVIKPRFAPRDTIDVLIAIPVSIYCLIILGAPGIFIGFLTHSFWTGYIAIVVAYFFPLLFWVRSISINDEGITFHRVLGKPKLLNWQEVESIVEVSRKELVFKGWLWPLPPRELTSCLSAKNHFRINWDGGFTYFPPKDIPLFKELTVRYLSLSHGIEDNRH